MRSSNLCCCGLTVTVNITEDLLCVRCPAGCCLEWRHDSGSPCLQKVQVYRRRQVHKQVNLLELVVKGMVWDEWRLWGVATSSLDCNTRSWITWDSEGTRGPVPTWPRAGCASPSKSLTQSAQHFSPLHQKRVDCMISISSNALSLWLRFLEARLWIKLWI